MVCKLSKPCQNPWTVSGLISLSSQEFIVFLAFLTVWFLHSILGAPSISNLKEELPCQILQRVPPLCPAQTQGTPCMQTIRKFIHHQEALPSGTIAPRYYFFWVLSPLLHFYLHCLCPSFTISWLYDWSCPLACLLWQLSPLLPPIPSFLFTIPLIVIPECKYENVTCLIKKSWTLLIKC